MLKDENELKRGDRVETPRGPASIISNAHNGLFGDEPYYAVILDNAASDSSPARGRDCFPLSQLKVISQHAAEL